jgi:hypothetical protein
MRNTRAKWTTKNRETNPHAKVSLSHLNPKKTNQKTSPATAVMSSVVTISGFLLPSLVGLVILFFVLRPFGFSRRRLAGEPLDLLLRGPFFFFRETPDVYNVGRLEGPDECPDPGNNGKKPKLTHEVYRFRVWVLAGDGDPARKPQNKKHKQDSAQADHPKSRKGDVIPQSDFKVEHGMYSPAMLASWWNLTPTFPLTVVARLHVTAPT